MKKKGQEYFSWEDYKVDMKKENEQKEVKKVVVIYPNKVLFINHLPTSQKSI